MGPVKKAAGPPPGRKSVEELRMTRSRLGIFARVDG